MNFKLQYGEDFDENYLKRIMEIDEIVYAEDGYVGELKNMVARYLVDPRRTSGGIYQFYPLYQGALRRYPLPKRAYPR